MKRNLLVNMKKLIYLIPLMFISCTSPKTIIKEVPVEVVKTEYKTELVHDSTYVHDSTFVYIKGDTVFKTDYKFRYIERTAYDTLITHDTIPQIITVENTKTVVKNNPQWWPVWLALGIVLLYLLITKTTFIKTIKNFIKYIINLFK